MELYGPLRPAYRGIPLRRKPITFFMLPGAQRCPMGVQKVPCLTVVMKETYGMSWTCKGGGRTHVIQPGHKGIVC